MTSLALALVVPSRPPVGAAVGPSRASRVVLNAAEAFGPKQRAAAEAWVEDAMTTGDGAKDPSELLQAQLTLFDECLIDDDGGKCKELDAALGSLEMKLKMGKASKAKLSRASARVRKAAADFGEDERRAAEVWIAGARDSGAANP